MASAWINAFGKDYGLEEAEAALSKAGFDDLSWKNDACPKWVRQDGVTVYADHPDPLKRIREAGSCLRYEVWIPDEDGDLTAESESFSSDSLVSVLSFIQGRA